MKKLLYSIALLSCSMPSFASSTKIVQIPSGTTKIGIQFNCIPELDSIISAVPSAINSFTMDLTNACNSLATAAQAYEDAADACSDLQAQADYYYNAAQAYLIACDLVLITTENIGAIDEVQNITYIQSYRCSALQAFNQSFGAYLELCLHNTNSPATKSIAANAVLALSYFLINLISLNKLQLNILTTLKQSSPAFASFIQPAESSSSCNPFTWYPIQLPGEDTAVNCPYKFIKIPENPTEYSGLASKYNNSNYDPRQAFGFPARKPDVPNFMMKVTGTFTPGASLLNEVPLYGAAQPSHTQGWLSSPTYGSYVSNGAGVYASDPLYDKGGLGNLLLKSPILDPYSNNDPKNNPNSPSYDENFANIVDIIPQPQYIYTTPTPTTVQSLHDAIRDYMYSADIHKMDSYIYNAYINVTAKKYYPEDVLPAIRRMGNARMKVVECYEGAVVKIVSGLTGKETIAPSAWSNLTLDDQSRAFAAAQGIIIILPMYNAIIQQIATYDIPLLNALSSLPSIDSTSSAQAQTTSSSTAINQAQQAAADTIQQAQKVAQAAATNQVANQQAATARALNQKAAAAQADQANISSQQATASAQKAQQSADLAAAEAAGAARTTQEAAKKASQEALAQATTANQQAQAAAAQAQTALAAAKQAAITGDLETATTQAQLAATAATTADQQAALAATAQQKTQQAAVTAINQAQAAEKTAQQARDSVAAQQAAAQLAGTQREENQYATALKTAAQQAAAQLTAAQQAAQQAGVTPTQLTQIVSQATTQLAAALQAGIAPTALQAENQLVIAQKSMDQLTSFQKAGTPPVILASIAPNVVHALASAQQSMAQLVSYQPIEITPTQLAQLTQQATAQLATAQQAAQQLTNAINAYTTPANLPQMVQQAIPQIAAALESTNQLAAALQKIVTPAILAQIAQKTVDQLAAAQQATAQTATKAAVDQKAAADAKTAADQAQAIAQQAQQAAAQAAAQATALTKTIAQAVSDQSSSQIQSAMGTTTIGEVLNPLGYSPTLSAQVTALQAYALKCITGITKLNDPASAANNSNQILGANQAAAALMQKAQQVITQGVNQNQTFTQQAQALQTAAQAWMQMVPTLTGYAQQYPSYAAIYNGFVTLCNQYAAALNKQAQQISSSANSILTPIQIAAQQANAQTVAAIQAAALQSTGSCAAAQQAAAQQAVDLTSQIGQSIIARFFNPSLPPYQQVADLQMYAQSNIRTMASLDSASANFNVQIPGYNVPAAALYQKAQQILILAVSQNQIPAQQAAQTWNQMISVLTGYAQQSPSYAAIYNGFIQMCTQYAQAFNTPSPITTQPIVQQPVVQKPAAIQPVAQPAPVQKPVVSQPIVQPAPVQKPVVSQPIVQQPVAVQKTAAVLTPATPKISPASEGQTSVRNIIAELFAQYEENNINR